MPIILPRDVLGPRSKRNAGFEQALASFPRHQVTRQAYALWLDTHDEMDYAFALRWMAVLDIHPSPATVESRVFEYWSFAQQITDASDHPNRLPRPVFQRLREISPSCDSWEHLMFYEENLVYHNGSWWAARSVRLVHEYLAVALKQLRAEGVEV